MSVIIKSVDSKSPAEKAGLKAGQVIVGFKGRSIASMEELADILSYTKAGETVNIVVKELTNGEYVEKTIEVELGSKADAPSTEQSQENQENQEKQQQQEEQRGGTYRGYFGN